MINFQKLAVKIGLMVSFALIICFSILVFILNRNNSDLVTRMLTNQMNDVVSSREYIIKDYVTSAEEYLEAFSKSDEVRNALLFPDNSEYVSRAQDYTVEFAGVKGIFEGLYIANTDSKVYAHTNESAIGAPTRKGDALKELQDTMMTKNEIYNCGIIKSPSSGNMVMSLNYPLFDASNKCIGYVGAAVYANKLMDSILTIKMEGMPNAEYVFINTDSGKYIYNKDDELINTDVQDKAYQNIIEKINNDSKIDIGIENAQNEDSSDSIVVYKNIPDRHWVFMVRDTKENIYSTLVSLNQITIITSILVAILNIIIVVLLLSSVSRKLSVVQKGIKKLGRLDLSDNREVKNLSIRKDEIGLICSTLDKTNSNLRTYIEEIDKQLAAMANGDFTLASNFTYEGAFKKINVSLTNIQSSLRNSFKEIATVTSQLSEGSQNVAQAASSLAEASSAERSLTLEIENNANEISKTVAVSTNNALSAKEKTSNAQKIVGNSKDKMDELLIAMRKIEDTANNIVDINNNMERIARQTHLLALNASVEATHAGDAGRGFAVVANEIRDLAEKSNIASGNASIQIEQTLEAVTIGTELASQTSDYLNEVVKETTTIDNSVSEIADAAVQQKDKLTGISNKLREIGNEVDLTAATSEESAAASLELESQIKILENNLRKYKVN